MAKLPHKHPAAKAKFLKANLKTYTLSQTFMEVEDFFFYPLLLRLSDRVYIYIYIIEGDWKFQSSFRHSSPQQNALL